MRDLPCDACGSYADECVCDYAREIKLDAIYLHLERELDRVKYDQAMMEYSWRVRDHEDSAWLIRWGGGW